MANWCDNYIIIDKGLIQKQFNKVKNIIKKRENNPESDDTIFTIGDMKFKNGVGTASVDSRWVPPLELLKALHTYLEPLDVNISCSSYEAECDIFAQYVNGDVEYYTSDKIPHWFLRLFGGDLIEEYT